MTDILSLDDKARLVLDTYAHFGCRAGKVLQDRNFYLRTATTGFSYEDVLEGLAHCYDKGWVEDGNNKSHKLTAAGFAAI